MTLDIILVIGDFKGIVEAVTGKEWITGRKLSGLERGFSLISQKNLTPPKMINLLKSYVVQRKGHIVRLDNVLFLR